MTSTSTGRDAPRQGSQSDSAITQSLVNQAPTINGRYVLDRVVDEDEFRTRYLATDLSMGRTVMAELFSSAIRIDTNLEGRLLRRLGRLAQTRQRGIPRLLDGGLDDHMRPFVVTEPIFAPTLRSLLRDSQYLVGYRVANCVAEIARTLQAAHDLGLVHGRVCPGNIHLDASREQAWVMGWVDGAMPRTRTHELFREAWIGLVLPGPGDFSR